MTGGKSSRRYFSEPANDSPSPWGEDRVEGGRKTFFKSVEIRASKIVGHTDYDLIVELV
jgi:hypothetical protein